MRAVQTETRINSSRMAAGFDTVYVDGEFVDADAARVSIKAHAVSYGTGTFEGIRATWNAEHDELYVLEPLAHFERMRGSANALGLELPHEPQELVDITIELLRRNEARQDVYVRPILLLSGEVLPVRMHDIETSFSIAVSPFPSGYVNTVGIRAGVSSWRRAPDSSMPIRAKINGSYVGPALAKTEAVLAGFDEAILLTIDGAVCEGTTSNVFIRRGNRWATPAATEDNLEGITRRQLITLMTETGGIVDERTIDRSELYICDEALLCATAVQISPLVEIDHRPVGSGEAGEQTLHLIEELGRIARGENDRHREWVVPVWGDA
jgi:branched-chain amino acid aminotransferase